MLYTNDIIISFIRQVSTALYYRNRKTVTAVSDTKELGKNSIF